jgi:hypothetical protein
MPPQDYDPFRNAKPIDSVLAAGEQAGATLKGRFSTAKNKFSVSQRTQIFEQTKAPQSQPQGRVSQLPI